MSTGRVIASDNSRLLKGVDSLYIQAADAEQRASEARQKVDAAIKGVAEAEENVKEARLSVETAEKTVREAQALVEKAQEELQRVEEGTVRNSEEQTTDRERDLLKQLFNEKLCRKRDVLDEKLCRKEDVLREKREKLNVYIALLQSRKSASEDAHENVVICDALSQLCYASTHMNTFAVISLLSGSKSRGRLFDIVCEPKELNHLVDALKDVIADIPGSDIKTVDENDIKEAFDGVTDEKSLRSGWVKLSEKVNLKYHYVCNMGDRLLHNALDKPDIALV